MKATLLGRRQSGKSTLFSALTRTPLKETGGYGHERRIAVVELPDPRVDRLAEIYRPRKVTYPSLTLIDPAPPTPGEPGVLTAAAIADARASEAIVVVVRAFTNPAVPRETPLDPTGDLRLLQEELLLADLAMVETRLERLEKEARGRPKGAAGGAAERAVLEKARAHLEAGRLMRQLDLTPHEREAVHHLEFVTMRPQVVVANIDERQVGQPPSPALVVLQTAEEGEGTRVLAICAPLEAELAQLEPEEEAAFLEELGLRESGRVRLGRALLEAGNLLTFYTGGPPEVRAWTLPRGGSAQDAAGRIHSDMARGFIRAEVVAADDLIAAGSERPVREQGLYHVEQKGYRVQDGDVITIRFSV
ncbi:MAG: redox-regulated ATPase YchF [Armatimonadetes bacterium]|nr:redox-regulated ATPase YchF [Armatimonadota bacterium]